VVRLVGLDEMSYADVALALDIPDRDGDVATVARERLRALMTGTQQEARLKVVR
jgi:RNA polymerase sigma-70 factor, ECF subfamily